MRIIGIGLILLVSCNSCMFIQPMVKSLMMRVILCPLLVELQLAELLENLHFSPFEMTLALFRYLIYFLCISWFVQNMCLFLCSKALLLLYCCVTQLYCEKDRLQSDQFEQLKNLVDIGDIVGATGSMKRTEKGECV